MALIAIILFAALLTPLPSAAAGPSTAAALPVPGFAPGWTAEGKVTLFDKENLFDHIDGEAELYFPYGFAELATVTYINKANPDLAVIADVYKMGSPLDAFGIYSNYRRPDSTGIAVGTEGFVSAPQVFFYQERYFVRISVSGSSPPDPDVLLALSRAIARRLPLPAVKPPELVVFAIPAVVPRSERYMAKSLLGYAFFRRGIVADAELAGERVQVFVVFEESEAAAGETFGRYLAYLGKPPQQGDGTIIATVDPLFGPVFVCRQGRYLIGAVRMKEANAVRPLVDALRKRLENGAAAPVK